MTGKWQAFCGISKALTSTRFLTKEAAQAALDRHRMQRCPGPHAVWPPNTESTPGERFIAALTRERVERLEAWITTLTRQRDEAISRRAGVLGRDDEETAPAAFDAVPDTPASLRVFNTIFNALSRSLPGFAPPPLSERMRITADIYDALRESGVEIRMEGSGDD